MRFRTTPGPRPAPAGRLDVHAAVESLEPRVLLSNAPLPMLDSLENAANPVLRVETSLGVIDIELFADTAPRTIAKVLGVVGRGEVDATAFHRHVDGQVLQWGVFRPIESTTPDLLSFERSPLTTYGVYVPPSFILDLQTVDLLDTNRPADMWTVSVSEVHWLVNAAPNGAQAFASLTVNLADGASDSLLQGENLSHTASMVIGRVLPGASRDTVGAITELPTLDATEFYPGLHFDRTPEALHDLPVMSLPPGGVAPEPAQLVMTSDLELIKGEGAGGFFEHRLYFPEGFAGSTISEFVPIANPNDQPVHYQLIARFETGERDMLIASGMIGAGSRGGVTVSRSDDPAGSLVPWGRAYALELHSTLPLTATMSHYDFGAATGEGFTDLGAETWHFADAAVDEGFHSFLVWQNTLDTDASVEVVFYPENLEIGLRPFTVTTGAHRRGGLDLSALDLPAGRYAIRINSSAPIVAALSQYDNRGGVEAASTELGVPQSIARGGALPMARIDGSITLFNPADPTLIYLIDPTAEVTVTFTSADPQREPVHRVFSVAAGQIIRFELEELAAELGTAPFAVRFTANNDVVLRSARGPAGDDAANPFSIFAAERWGFAEGFMDPARAGTDVFETLAVYNTMNNLTVQNEVTVTFRFADGTSIDETFSLAPAQHLFLDLHAYAPLLEQAAAGRNFYSMEVASQFPTVAQLWHDDLTLGGASPAGGFGTIGSPLGARFAIDMPPVFVPF